MTPDLLTAIIAIVSALLGGGGYAAYVRAQGQNRLDLYQAAAERMSRLEARNDDQDKRNDVLLVANAELNGRIIAIQRDNEMLSERLRVQRILIDDQGQRLASLSSLQEENVRLRQQLQIEMSKREFLEKEVAELRSQVCELRAQMNSHGKEATRYE